MAKQSYTTRLLEKPQREQTVIAVSFLVALVLFVSFGIVAPLFSWHDEMDVAHDEMTATGQKYAQIATRSEAQIQVIDTDIQTVSMDGLIYNNPEASLSVAQFEGDLRAAIGRMGLSIETLLPGLPEPSEGIWLLPATIEVTGHPSKFTELVYILENTPPLIRIDRIEILANGDDRQAGLLKARIHSFHMGTSSDG